MSSGIRKIFSLDSHGIWGVDVNVEIIKVIKKSVELNGNIDLKYE